MALHPSGGRQESCDAVGSDEGRTMNSATITATVTAVVGLVTALFGVAFTVLKFRDERRQRLVDLQDQRQRWRTEFESGRKEWIGDHRSALRSEFLHELVRQRYKVYPPVLRTLGAVRDIPDPAQEHYRSLIAEPERLTGTADEILQHLYSDAGLIMSMETRNQLLAAWYACHRFQAGDATIDSLVREFYRARRALRGDLQLDDEASPITVAGIEKELSS
jgi:hypothetical protein